MLAHRLARREAASDPLGFIVAFLLAILVLLLIAGAAHAQDVAGVSVGPAIGALADFVWPVVASAALFLIRRLPKELYNVLIALRVEQLIAAAVQHGLNATKGATKDVTLTLPVGNSVAQAALEYAMAHAPQLSALFGVGRLREKILARLNFDETAEVKSPAPPAGVG